MISRRTIVLTLLLAFSFGFAAEARSLSGRYFVVVWGFEGDLSSPTEAHTFATFYRGDDLAAGGAGATVISWLPATGVVQDSGVEKGRNFSLGATLALARKRGRHVAAFGPYEISAETYSHALTRVRLLNSGRVAYTMINGPTDAMNCIEAVGSVGGPISTGLSFGLSASMQVADHLALHQAEVDRDAGARLNLRRYAAAR